MVLAPQPGPHCPVGQLHEVGQHAGKTFRWPCAGHGAQPGCQLGRANAGGIGWRQHPPAVVEVGEALCQSDPAAIDQRDRRDPPVPRRQLEDNVAAPGLTGDDGRSSAGPAQHADQRREIGGGGRCVVPVRGLLRLSVPPQVDRDHLVPGGGQPDGNPVPHPRIGSQAVHQQERPAGAFRPAHGQPRTTTGQDHSILALPADSVPRNSHRKRLTIAAARSPKSGRWLAGQTPSAAVPPSRPEERALATRVRKPARGAGCLALHPRHCCCQGSKRLE